MIQSGPALVTAHTILLDLMIVVRLREEYKLCSCLLCVFLQPNATFSLLGPVIISLFCPHLPAVSSLCV